MKKEFETKTLQAFLKQPLRHKMNLQFFAEPEPKNEPSNETDDEPFATFKTKDDLNKRLTRAEKKGQKELATQLGYESVEAMLEALGKKNEPNNNDNQQQNTDTQQVDIDKLLEEKLKEEHQKTFKRLVTSEVKVLANELGFADWEDALKLADLSDVKEDDNGNITGVKEALEALAKKKPHLLKQQTNGTFGAPVPNNTNQGGTKNLEEIKKMAQSRGVTQTQAYNPWA